MDNIFPGLARLRQNDITLPPLRYEARLASWEAVHDQLNEQNVDDGINICAARMRHLKNRERWGGYVGSTVLSRSEKDWGSGYSSQLNMPMTLPGYFLYSRHKYERSTKRIQDMETWIADPSIQLPAAMTTGTMRKNIDTWFWRTVVWRAVEAYAANLSPRLYAGGLWTPQNVARWTMPTLRNLAFLYLIASKALTGALASLSEPDQLKLQQYAWVQNSTAVMSTDSPAEERSINNALGQFSQAPVNIDQTWLEYHSAMKDLTGLWFKGALFDVILSEDSDIIFLCNVGDFLSRPDLDIWTPIFTELMRKVKSDDWNAGLDRLRPDYIDDLEELNWRTLAPRISQIQTRLGAALQQADGWDALRMNGDRATRKFLHYSDAPPWEGRYDTMYSPIFNGTNWTYLVEHRFN